MNILFFFIALIMLNGIHHSQDVKDTLTINRDSVFSQKTKEIFLSGNLNQMVKFKDATNSSLNINTKISFINILNSSSNKSKKEFTLNYAFVKFIDSLWIKTIDELKINYNLAHENPNRIRSLNFNLKTQLSNTYRNYKTYKKLIEEPGFPLKMNLGFGFNFQLNRNSIIQFSLFESQLILISSRIEVEREKFNRWKNGIEYNKQIGMALNTSIDFPISNKVIWKNNSHFFMNGFHKNDYNFDFYNRFIYSIRKKINISLESQMILNPVFSPTIQFRNELLIGIKFNKVSFQSLN